MPDPIMDSERITQAFSRLEAAIGRLEDIGHMHPSDERVAALEEKNRRLREGTSEALARLDQLIGRTAPPVAGG
jgi:hypothetical protein